MSILGLKGARLDGFVYSTHKLHNERYVHKIYDITAEELKPCAILILFIEINKYIMMYLNMYFPITKGMYMIYQIIIYFLS